MNELVDYLAGLNTAENQWSLYVNPFDVDDYRIGQDIFDNGGVLDNKIRVAGLDRVSFGSQSRQEALKQVLKIECFEYNGKRLKVNAKGILAASFDGKLDPNFEAYLDIRADAIMACWSEQDAEFWVDELKESMPRESIELAKTWDEADAKNYHVWLEIIKLEAPDIAAIAINCEVNGTDSDSIEIISIEDLPVRIEQLKSQYQK